jgi:adenylate cyclase class 2
MLEIEIKVKADNLPHIQRELEKIGATYSEHLTEHDTYYNAPHRDFKKTDEALRLRKTQNGITLTYKGEKKVVQGVKARKEYNLSVDSQKTTHEILTHLGFVPVADVIKERDYYTFEDFSIALDEVGPLGTFVEIELVRDEEKDTTDPATQIAEFAQRIGVTGDRISYSYLELIMQCKA